MRSPHHLIVRAATGDPRVLSRFWASVDRPASPESCWEWQGGRTSDQHPVFRVKHHAVSAARLAWFAATGEFPLAGRIRRTCQNISCVRPEHLDWELGRTSERMLEANFAGYVPVATLRSGARAPEMGTLRRRAS